MSLAGLKKQINKANQFMSEKIGGAKGTELDEDYVGMEKKMDATEKLVGDLMVHTQEYLQPNPGGFALRAKLMTQNAWSKVRGQSRNTMYPQPEGTLGETLAKHGEELGPDSCFGTACQSTGDAFMQLAEVKYTLEEVVKNDFLDPLASLQSTDFKRISHHRKKLEGRRLDYDCKKRKKEKDGGSVEEAELTAAEEKFEESRVLAKTAMQNFLSSEVEQISQLKAFVEAVMTYHKNSASIMEKLAASLADKAREAEGKPRPKKEVLRPAATAASSLSPATNDQRLSTHSLAGIADANGKTSPSLTIGAAAASPTKQTSATRSAASPKKPLAHALYDFEPENEGELGFKEGDAIELTQQIDENWFEGRVHGQTGFFPINYVKVVVPL